MHQGLGDQNASLISHIEKVSLATLLILKTQKALGIQASDI